LLWSWSPVFADLTLVAESNGFPGQTSSSEALLTISVKEKAMRIVNPSHFHVVTIDLAENRFCEFLATLKKYEQKTVSDFEQFRNKRETERRRQIDIYNKLSDGPEKLEALKSLQREGIEPNGSIVAKLEKTGKKKPITVRMDGQDREYVCEQVLIRENNALKPVFELWVTTEI